jgi:hypothetical protein
MVFSTDHIALLPTHSEQVNLLWFLDRLFVEHEWMSLLRKEEEHSQEMKDSDPMDNSWYIIRFGSIIGTKH